MTGGDRIERIANMEIGTHSALHRRLEASDGETKSNGERINETLAITKDPNGGKEGRASRKIGNCLAVRDIYISDIELLEEGADAFGHIERDGGSESVGYYTHPDGWIAVVTLAILGGYNKRDIIVAENFIIGVVSPTLSNVNHPVLLIEPCKSNKVNTGEPDRLCIE